MAERKGAGKRSNSHDLEKFPLATDDEYERLHHSESLLEALYQWGGSDAVWADYLGVSERTVRRWIDDPSGMNSEALDKTCALTGVSRGSLIDGHVTYRGVWSPSTWWRPSAAEKDRYDEDTMKKAYAQLDKEDQRLVTQFVEKLLVAKRDARALESGDEWTNDLIIRAYKGEVSDEEWEHIYFERFEAELIADEQADEWLQTQAIPETRQRIAELKEARRVKLRDLRNATDAIAGHFKDD